MEAYEIKTALETIESLACDAVSSFDEIEVGATEWEMLAGEGWGEANDVIDALSQGQEWRDWADSLGIDLSEADDKLTALACIEEETEGNIRSAEDARRAIEALKGVSNGHADGVLAAIQLLVAALTEAGVLTVKGRVTKDSMLVVTGTVSVPAGSDTHATSAPDYTDTNNSNGQTATE